MVRAWIANKELHVTLNLGVWANAINTEVDERDAWGMVLSDLVRHIANGLHQSHGWEPADSIHLISTSFQDYLNEEEPDFSGGYPDDASNPH
jgi:hypothetical protein